MALLQPEPGVNISFSLIAHEVAHEWWNGAPTNNFEDWLNESFAEYASLMAIRAKFGYDIFEEWIQYKEFRSRGTPPILQSKTIIRAQTASLYDKGPLILYKLEKRIGEELFQKFLSELIIHNIKSTDNLLKLLEELTSKEIRMYFENELRQS
jgi:aminopeptidase N